jgi:hypothetical protein
MTCASESEAGVIYRRTAEPGRSYYERVTEPAVNALWKRLRGADPRTLQPSQLRTLQVLARVMEGKAVPFYRYVRGTDPMTGERYELKELVAVPPDYHLRAVQSPPGYR